MLWQSVLHWASVQDNVVMVGMDGGACVRAGRTAWRGCGRPPAASVGRIVIVSARTRAAAISIKQRMVMERKKAFLLRGMHPTAVDLTYFGITLSTVLDPSEWIGGAACAIEAKYHREPRRRRQETVMRGGSFCGIRVACRHWISSHDDLSLIPITTIDHHTSADHAPSWFHDHAVEIAITFKKKKKPHSYLYRRKCTMRSTSARR